MTSTPDPHDFAAIEAYWKEITQANAHRDGDQCHYPECTICYPKEK